MRLNAIKVFISRPTWPLIIAATLLLFITVVMSLSGIGYAINVDEERRYIKENKQYTAWTETPEYQVCDQIRKACESARSSHLSEIDAFLGARDAEDACRTRNPAWSDRCSLPKPRAPDSFKITQVFESPLVLFPLLVPLTFFSLRRFFLINHLGWQRVTFLGSIGVGFLTLVLLLNYAELKVATVLQFAFVVLSTTLFALSLPSYLSSAYRWITEGFRSGGAAASTHEPIDQVGHANERLTLSWRPLKGLLWACVAVLIFTAAFVLSPESTARGMVVAALAGVAVLSIRAVARLFKAR